MAQTKYTRTISGDFSGTFPNLSDFRAEVVASDIATEYLGGVVGVGEGNNDCEFYFADALSSADETIFDSLVTAHEGNLEDTRTREDIMSGIFAGATSPEQIGRLLNAINIRPAFVTLLDQGRPDLARLQAQAGLAEETIIQADYDLIDQNLPGYVEPE